EKNIKPYIKEANQNIYDAYNTYVCKGLPVGPICNPGLAAIKAALYPEDTKNYYFVTDAEGNFYYAKTYAQHKQNCKKAGVAVK
ncbi:MAG: endolytic transglycosylase MltG, partial [Oscillospiraceae bacterium]|nr:endolytic transglycosylase MltG [Oscillospiraceae bacterium]